MIYPGSASTLYQSRIRPYIHIQINEHLPRINSSHVSKTKTLKPLLAVSVCIRNRANYNLQMTTVRFEITVRGLVLTVHQILNITYFPKPRQEDSAFTYKLSVYVLLAPDTGVRTGRVTINKRPISRKSVHFSHALVHIHCI